MVNEKQKIKGMVSNTEKEQLADVYQNSCSSNFIKFKIKFSCENCKIFKNSFFYRTPTAATSEYIRPDKVKFTNPNSKNNKT